MIHNGPSCGRDSLASNTSEIQMQHDISHSFKHGVQSDEPALQAAAPDEESFIFPQATPGPRDDPSAKLRGATRSGTPPRLALHDLNALRGVAQDNDQEDADQMQVDGHPSPGIGLTANSRLGNQAHGPRRLFTDSPGSAYTGRTSSAMGDLTGQVNLEALAEYDELDGGSMSTVSMNPVTPQRKTSLPSGTASAASAVSAASHQDMLRDYKKKKYAMTHEERRAAGYDTGSEAPGTPQDDSLEFDNGDGWASSTPNSERHLASPSPTVDMSSISNALDAQNSVHRRRVEEVLGEEGEGPDDPAQKHHPEARRSFPKRLDAHKGRTSTGSNDSETALVGWDANSGNAGSTVHLDIAAVPVEDMAPVPIRDSEPRSAARRAVNTPIRSTPKGVPEDSPSPGTHALSSTQMSIDFARLNKDFEEQLEENGHSPLGESPLGVNSGLDATFDKPIKEQPGKIAAFAPSADPRAAGLAAILRGNKPTKVQRQEQSPQQEGVITPHYGSSPAKFNMQEERSFVENDCLEAKSELQVIAPPKPRPASQVNTMLTSPGTRQPKRAATIAEISRSPGRVCSKVTGFMSMPELLEHCGIDLDHHVMPQRRSEMPREQDSQLDSFIASDGPGADTVRNGIADNQKVRNRIFEKYCAEVFTSIEGYGKEKETYVQRWDRHPTTPVLVQALNQAKNSTSQSALNSFKSRMAEFQKHCKQEAHKRWAEIKYRRNQSQLTAMKEHTYKLRQALQHVKDGNRRAEDVMAQLKNVRDKYQAEADTVRKGMQLQEQRKKFSKGEVESQNVLSACHEQLQFEKDHESKLQQCKRDNETQMQHMYEQLKEMREGLEKSQRTETQLRLALGFRTMRPVLSKNDEDVLRLRRGHHITVRQYEGKVQLQFKPSETLHLPSFRAPTELVMDLLERAWSQTITSVKGSLVDCPWIAHVPDSKVSMVLRRLDLFAVRLAALQDELETLKKDCPEIKTIDCCKSRHGAPLQLQISLMSSTSHAVQNGVLRSISGANTFKAEKVEIVFGGDLLSYPDIDWTDAAVRTVFGHTCSLEVKRALASQQSGAPYKNLSAAVMTAAQVVTAAGCA
jgi:hypothetical protein